MALSPQRKREVPEDFDRVAASYDLLTGMNPGYHRHLRMSAERLRLPARGEGLRLLDLCCGTGASTEALRRAYPEAEIVALDASSGMLREAEKKASLRGVCFLLGDAHDPAAAGAEGPFDGALVAYGVRNLAEPDRGLSNLLALLAPGGRAAIHEYSVADSKLAQAVWSAVCWGVIIPGGLLTARSARIYRYLHQSVRAFDGVQAFEARMRRAGFRGVRTEEMDGWQRGIVHTFLGERPPEGPRGGEA